MARDTSCLRPSRRQLTEVNSGRRDDARWVATTRGPKRRWDPFQLGRINPETAPYCIGPACNSTRVPGLLRERKMTRRLKKAACRRMRCPHPPSRVVQDLVIESIALLMPFGALFARFRVLERTALSSGKGATFPIIFEESVVTWEMMTI
jgi:hypothetical protein